MSNSVVEGPVGHLRSVQAIDLSDCVRLLSIDGLGGAGAVVLARMPTLADLRPLGSSVGAPTRLVRLVNMPAVMDVSPLACCHTVELIQCINVRDVSPLANLSEVTIEDCPQVRNVDALARVPRVMLQLLVSLRSAAALTGCQHLIILSCIRLTNVEGLEHAVPNLIIRHCPKVPSIVQLRHPYTNEYW